MANYSEVVNCKMAGLHARFIFTPNGDARKEAIEIMERVAKSGTKITIVCGTSKICDKVKLSLSSIVDEFYIVTGSTSTTVEFDGFDEEQCVDAQKTLRLELLNLGLTEKQFKIIVS